MSQDKPQDDMFSAELDATIGQALEHVDAFKDADLKLLYSSRLVEFYELHSHVLKSMAGIEGEQNHKLSVALVTAIGNYFGGVSFYLPHNDKLKKFMRDIEIFTAFNGDNVSELARKFGVSQQTIYNAVSRQRELRQRKLPLDY